MGLEYLIRPFQTPRAQGGIRIPSTPLNPHEKAILTWGAQGTPPKAVGTGFQVICLNRHDKQPPFGDEPLLSAFDPVPASGQYTNAFGNWDPQVMEGPGLDWNDLWIKIEVPATDTEMAQHKDADIQHLSATRPVIKVTETDDCADNWDQFSGVGAQVSATLGEFEQDIHSGTVGSTPNHYKSLWNLNLQSGGMDPVWENNPNPYPNG
jgi:hypothetical protein